MIDYTSEYLTQQIIAYIGNKRKLLPLIYKALESSNLELKPGLRFFDAFAGSGVVSRFAKMLGFEVFCNDWEQYAHVINSAYLGIDKKDIAHLFGNDIDFENLINKINTLPSPLESEQYIAQYYAPKEFDIKTVDYRTERLFYTRSNALAIDKIRNYIEENYSKDDEITQKQKNLLISLLLYEAATHTNTSGVFKAFHKEFGGHGKDALKRILSPIALQKPVLFDSVSPVHIYKEDTNTLVKHLGSLDVAYLDPPYNQHQYGSNYHLLNTIAKWDHVAAPLTLNAKGILKEKAGIRHDWSLTQSPYCYKKDAPNAFIDLINNIDAKRILISYSTDGIIPFEQMREICMSRGDTSIVTNEYTTYRGGKQSNSRKTSNIEFVLCIDTTKKATTQCIPIIDALLAKKKLLLLFKQKYSRKKLKSCNKITLQDGLIFVELAGITCSMKSKDYFLLESPDEYDKLTTAQIKELSDILLKCICTTKEEELEEILFLTSEECTDNIIPKEKWVRILPSTLKKIASKKNHDIYIKWLNKIESMQTSSIQRQRNLYCIIKEDIEEIKIIANLRFTT